MEIALYCVLDVVLLVAYCATRPGSSHTGPYLPDALVLNLLLYAVGALVISNTTNIANADIVLKMSLTALASGLVGVALFSLAMRNSYARVDFRSLHRQSLVLLSDVFAVRLIASVSILASFWFLYQVFTSPILSPFLSIENIIKYSSLRFARTMISSGTAGYMAPGLIAQFRDVLLPIVLCSMVLLYKNPLRSPVFIALLSITVISMLVLGARSNIVFLVLSIALSLYYANDIKMPSEHTQKITLGRLLVVSVVLFGSWMLLSAALGRSTTSDRQQTAVDVPIDAVSSLLDRASLTLPRENSQTYHIWAQMGPTSGEYWSASFATIFKTDTPQEHALARLSSHLSFVLSGSIGDSPLGLPPDVWLAWGWTGLLIIPMLYAFVIGIIDLLLLSENSLLFFGIKIFLIFTLPLIVSPYLFALYGGVICLMLIVAVKASNHLKPWLPARYMKASLSRPGH